MPRGYFISMRYVLLILLWPWAVTAAQATEATAPKKAPATPAASVQSPAPKRASGGDAMWVRLSSQAILRDGPSVNARILANVDLGSEAKVMWRRRDGWVEIRLPASSLVGWTRAKNLPPASGGSAAEQVQNSGTAKAERQTNEKLQPAPQKPARMASGRKHRKSVASSHRSGRHYSAEPQPGSWKWRGAYAHFRTFGYRYY